MAVSQFVRGPIGFTIHDSQPLKSHVDPFPTDANFILFRTQSSSSRVHASLLDKGILIRSFEQKEPLIDCLRVTVGTDKQNHEFLSNLAITLSQD